MHTPLFFALRLCLHSKYESLALNLCLLEYGRMLYVRMYLCMYVRMYVSMYVCTYVCIFYSKPLSLAVRVYLLNQTSIFSFLFFATTAVKSLSLRPWVSNIFMENDRVRYCALVGGPNVVI